MHALSWGRVEKATAVLGIQEQETPPWVYLEIERAIEAGQPEVRNEAAAMRGSSSPSSRMKIRIESPQTGFVTNASASASAISPALRGRSKWSISVEL